MVSSYHSSYVVYVYIYIYPTITIPIKGKVSDYYIAGACYKSDSSKESVRDFFMNSRSRTPTKKQTLRNRFGGRKISRNSRKKT